MESKKTYTIKKIYNGYILFSKGYSGNEYETYFESIDAIINDIKKGIQSLH